MEKLKILQVYDHMQLGGAESHIITLSKGLIDSGHSVQIVSSNGPFVSQIKKFGIKFHELSLNNSDNYLINVDKILEIIEEEKIDIVHVHPFHSQIIMGLVRLIKNIPLVTTIHGAYSTPCVNGLAEFFDYIICISKESYNFHINNNLILSNELELIPNCVPTMDFKRTPILQAKILRIGYISRLDEDKFDSILFFINCIEVIVNTFEVEISIVGQGSKYNEVLSIIENINTKFNKTVVKLVKGVEDIVPYMNNFDVIIGVGRVLLEALSVGRIPICIGNSNYVGILNKEKLMKISEVNFTDRNTKEILLPELLINDLLKIKENQGHILKELDETIFKLMTNFDIKLSVTSHEKIYKKVLKHYSEKKVNLYNFNYKIDYIDNIKLAYSLIENNYSYVLDNVREKTVLFIPNFNDSNDMWQERLNETVVGNNNHTTTYIFRISNEFQINLNEFLEEIELNLKPLINLYQLDVLIDCEYHDNVTEFLFLKEMNYFVQTNNNQYKVKYLCRILGVKII